MDADSGGDNFLKVFAQKMQEKQRLLKESGKHNLFRLDDKFFIIFDFLDICYSGHVSCI